MRHMFGLALVAVAHFFAEVGHQFVHAGAWLMDAEMGDCPNCNEEDLDAYL